MTTLSGFFCSLSLEGEPILRYLQELKIEHSCKEFIFFCSKSAEFEPNNMKEA